MIRIIELANGIVWGVPTILLILTVGMYFSVQTGFVQFRLLPKAFHHLLRQLRPREDRSSYRALCTALAATVGTGNLAGVAGAICLGGPGAIFWMWICGFLGMVIKYAEATLSVHFQTRTSTGEPVGGPMYMIQKGLPRRFHWLGYIYCFFGVVAAFGVGNATQINTITSSVFALLGDCGVSDALPARLLLGVMLAALIGWTLLGGAQKIGETAERFVPFASVLYLTLGIGLLILRFDKIPAAFCCIWKGAFSPRAFTGGVIGSALVSARVGASRGVFTNEAGMGTAGIAHSSADVEHPVQQGMMGVLEVFLDTIVICTMTALVILCSNISIPYGQDTGIELTLQAFSSVYGGWIRLPLCLCVCCFALATVIGWGLYGFRCAEYLLGESVWRPFGILQLFAVVMGAVINTRMIWSVSELVNGLMAIPNLVALMLLSPKLFSITKSYLKRDSS